jgi:uncharacterized Tic20 family protein
VGVLFGFLLAFLFGFLLAFFMCSQYLPLQQYRITKKCKALKFCFAFTIHRFIRLVVVVVGVKVLCGLKNPQNQMVLMSQITILTAMMMMALEVLV